jgi:NADPH:quinone reductase-like Zn-dependent oxidoreductase
MAGVVESVGGNVTRFGPGDSVFGETIARMQWVNGGAFAEYVSVRHDLLAPKPDHVTFEQAASVPTAGYITLLNLGLPIPIHAGQAVLVNGAGGGVGALALQIAKARGARVTAVDTARKLEMLRSLGADEVVDGMQRDFTESAVRYDLVFDVPGNRPFSACRRVIAPDGRYVLIGHEGFGAAGKRVLGLIPHFFMLMFLSRFVRPLRGAGTPMPTKKAAMDVLGDLLAAGKITPWIDSVHPLSQVREAFRHMVEDETHGRVVLCVAGAD